MGCCNFDSGREKSGKSIKSIKTVDFFAKQDESSYSCKKAIFFSFKKRLFRGVELSVESRNLGKFFGSVKDVSFNYSYPIRSTEHYSCNSSIAFRCGRKDIILTEVVDSGAISLRVIVFEGTTEILRETYAVTAVSLLRSLVDDLKCLGVKVKESVETTFLCTGDTGNGYLRVLGKNIV